jgi:rhamnosyltransferase
MPTDGKDDVKIIDYVDGIDEKNGIKYASGIDVDDVIDVENGIDVLIGADAPQVSVIIPTLNAGPNFAVLLKRLQEQSCPPHEIIIIDSESTDGTPQIAKGMGARVLEIKRSQFDHGGTRNRAADAATGQILMFMTQDAMPENKHLIKELIAPLFFSSKKTDQLAKIKTDGPDSTQTGILQAEANGQTSTTVAMAYGRQLPYPDATPIEKLARESNYPETPRLQSYEDVEKLGLKAFFCSNVCSAVTKDMFLRMGKFQEPVIFNEDLFMSAKLILSGYRIAYCPEAKVIHSHNYSIKQQFKRFFDNGVSLSLNPMIRPYRSVGGAGSRMVLDQVKGLWRQNKAHHIPRLIAESGAKWMGFKLGNYHHRLPNGLVKRFSMHKGIWQHISNISGQAEQAKSKALGQ